jgi:hypothetical protein
VEFKHYEYLKGVQKIIFDKCNCRDPFSFYLKDTLSCQSIDQQGCMFNQYTSIYESNYFSTFCIPLCPLECNKTILKTSSSSFIDLSGELYYDFIKSRPNLLSDFVTTPLSVETAKNSFTSMTFYYSTNSYKVTTESPSMDIVALLANIGGTLGLFLGISLIQICELVEILIQMFSLNKNIKE